MEGLDAEGIHLHVSAWLCIAVTYYQDRVVSKEMLHLLKTASSRIYRFPFDALEPLWFKKYYNLFRL